MKWISLALKNFFNINGRSTRKEFWFFSISTTVILVLITTVALERAPGSTDAEKLENITTTFAWKIAFAFAIATMIPLITVAVRRLHDIGKSMKWLFIQFVPFVGPLWFIYLMAVDSQPGENKYGPNPKGIQADVSESSNVQPSQTQPDFVLENDKTEVSNEDSLT